MSYRFIDNVEITGDLQITKVFSDDRPDEIIFDDHNIIVSGMSVGLSLMFSLSGSQAITDFHLDRVQFGVGGDAVTEASSLFALNSPLSSIAQYGGTAAAALALSGIQIKDGVNVSDQVFMLIPFHNVARISDTSVRYTIILDEDAANSLPRGLDEIGLFMKNPTGQPIDHSIMVAYRKFSAITKSSDFALVFRWTVNF